MDGTNRNWNIYEYIYRGDDRVALKTEKGNESVFESVINLVMTGFRLFRCLRCEEK